MSIIDDLKYTPNKFESVLVKENPTASTLAIESAYLAESLMLLLYFHPWQQHNNGDAFRHCVWSALIAERTSPEWARRWTDAHEAELSDTDISKRMDLFNNDKGILLIREHPHISTVEIVFECCQLGKNGFLQKRNDYSRWINQYNRRRF